MRAINEIDYLIIGQGIAGSCLALELIKRKAKILVIDTPTENTASKVAAGLINPIVFKRLTLSWKINTLLPYATSFYHNLEKDINKPLLYKLKIHHIFSNDEERQFWIKQSSEPHLFDYVSVSSHNSLPAVFKAPFGEGIVNNAYYLDTNVFIEQVRAMLIDKKSFVEKEFQPERLTFEESSVLLDNIKAKKIIFCRGWQDYDNPYFSSGMFKLTKGEVLTLKTPLDYTDEVNKNCFFIKQKDVYKLGATYNWKELNNKPSDTGKEELLNKLEKFYKQPYTLLEHKAGIRPTTKDRRPIIGFSNKQPMVGIFNGLGTKGVVIAPYFAKLFSTSIINNTTDNLDKEVLVHRFRKS